MTEEEHRIAWTKFVSGLCKFAIRQTQVEFGVLTAHELSHVLVPWLLRTTGTPPKLQQRSTK